MNTFLYTWIIIHQTCHLTFLQLFIKFLFKLSSNVSSSLHFFWILFLWLISFIICLTWNIKLNFCMIFRVCIFELSVVFDRKSCEKPAFTEVIIKLWPQTNFLTSIPVHNLIQKFTMILEKMRIFYVYF